MKRQKKKKMIILPKQGYDKENKNKKAKEDKL